MSNPDNTTLQEVIDAGNTVQKAATYWNRAQCSIFIGNNGAKLQAADTNSDNVTDYLRLVGSGSAPNRKVEVYDDLEVDRNLVVRIGNIRFQSAGAKIAFDNLTTDYIQFTESANIVDTNEFAFFSQSELGSRLVAENAVVAYGVISGRNQDMPSPGTLTVQSGYNIDSVEVITSTLYSPVIRIMFTVPFENAVLTANVTAWGVSTDDLGVSTRTGHRPSVVNVYLPIIDISDKITGFDLTVSYWNSSSKTFKSWPYLLDEDDPELTDILLHLQVIGKLSI